MKKPQKPPAFDRLWSDYLDKYNDLASKVNQKTEESEEIRKLIRKYNEQEYIHWDDLRRKKIPYDNTTFWYVIRTIRSTKYREIRIGDEKFPFYTPEKFHKQTPPHRQGLPCLVRLALRGIPERGEQKTIPHQFPDGRGHCLQPARRGGDNPA